MGSLAGAAHLIDNNSGVLRSAQREQKSLVEQKVSNFKLYATAARLATDTKTLL